MYISRDQLFKCVAVLDRIHSQLDCSAPRKDAAGNEARLLNKNARTESLRDVPVPYGTHGSDYAVIDPETLEVQCGACLGVLDSTVKE